MKKTEPLASGDAGPYGAGMLVRKWRGLPVLEHGGFMLGFQHHWMYLPEQSTTVILMTSNAEVDFSSLLDQLVVLALGPEAPVDAADTPAPVASAAGKPVTPAEALPDISGSTAGCFHNAEIPLAMALDVAEGNLFVHPATFRRIPAKRASPLEFTAMGGEIRLRVDTRADGSTPGFTMEHRDLGSIYFSRTDDSDCAFAK
jgi:hypothetical protein